MLRCVRTFLSILTVVAVLDAQIAGAQDVSGMALFNECSSSDVFMQYGCANYIFGVMDGFAAAVPKGYSIPYCSKQAFFSNRQLAMIYTNWARSHPGELGRDRTMSDRKS